MRYFHSAIALIVLLAGVSASANLTSPLRSTIPGVNIPNAHVVLDFRRQGGGVILRGMAPLSQADYATLSRLGVRDVVIFKNEIKSEVRDEIAILDRIGIRSTSIPFKWKDFQGLEQPCLQTLEALSALAHSVRAKRTSYFHCTVGEDRTGYLAGLLRLMTDPSQRASDVFANELCERGFAEGNPYKPRNVVAWVHQYMTPLYLNVAYLVKKGAISWNRLDPAVCRVDLAKSAEYRAFVRAELATGRYQRCQTSSLVKPRR